jgi:UDP-glucose-4-epimerase GalE
MRVLVIGGAGYIGSHTARALQCGGHEAILFDNLSTGHRRLAAGFELIEGDVHDAARVREALRGADAAMYFAGYTSVAESVRDPRKYFDNNVFGGLTLLHAMLDAGVLNIVFSSTAAVYGTPSQVPIPESAERRPVNPYGETKLIFEMALVDYGRAYGLKSASLRYFNAAGADESGEIGEMHDPETHLIPLALAAAAGTSGGLDIYGDDYPTPDGTCIRDYIHVTDLADAHVRALEHLAAGKDSFAANLGSGRGNTVKEVIAAVEKVTRKKVPTKMAARRAGDPPALVADPTLAQQFLGWKVQHSLEDCVRSAWKWMQRAQR